MDKDVINLDDLILPFVRIFAFAVILPSQLSFAPPDNARYDRPLYVGKDANGNRAVGIDESKLGDGFYSLESLAISALERGEVVNGMNPYDVREEFSDPSNMRYFFVGHDSPREINCYLFVAQDDGGFKANLLEKDIMGIGDSIDIFVCGYPPMPSSEDYGQESFIVSRWNNRSADKWHNQLFLFKKNYL